MGDIVEFKRRSVLIADDPLIEMLSDFSVESIIIALFGALDEPDLARIARDITEYFEWKRAGEAEEQA